MTTMTAFQEDGPGLLWKMPILVLNKQKVLVNIIFFLKL